MKPIKISLLAAVIFAISGCSAHKYQLADRERIEWTDVWLPNSTDAKLPRVLLIRNSITKAYYPAVAKLLDGKAYVCKLATSQFLSDPMLLSTLKNVLDHYHFDVIHFNNGMHGWQHSEQEYRLAFKKYISLIRKHAPGAKLIWAKTTPLKVNPHISPGDPIATDERIIERNNIAQAFISGTNIETDDLFTPMYGHPEYHTDNVHFNAGAQAVQAAQVAAIIEKALPR